MQGMWQQQCGTATSYAFTQNTRTIVWGMLPWWHLYSSSVGHFKGNGGIDSKLHQLALLLTKGGVCLHRRWHR